MTELAKQPSEDLISMIKVAGDSLLSFGELWGSIKKKGATEGFSETDLQEMLRPYLKQKMDSKKIWYLFNKEDEQERNKQNYQSRTFKQKIDEKKEPEQFKPRIHESIPELKNVTDKQIADAADIDIDEEPTEAELLKIENEQLKDALHKTQQFTQATKLPLEDDINNVVIRAGVGAIENLIRLEIPKLRNRGWKTVEITMRAV
jgi:hypothetical protein